MSNNVPVTNGQGQSSIAAEDVSGVKYQQIEVYGGGGASVLAVNPDGSFKASIIGRPSISGTVDIGIQSGSVVAYQGGAWTPSVSGAVQIYGNASLATVHVVDDPVASSMVALVTDTIIHGRSTAGGGSYVEVKVDPSGALVTALGSVVSFQSGTWRTSVISSTPSSMLAGASIFGQLPAGTAVLGSVATLQGTNPWNIAGSVAAIQTGTWSTSVMTNVITSIATAGQVMGSVATLQGTNPWVVNFQNSSILAVPVGSTIALLQSPSIVGTYAEDAAHTTGDKGLLSLNVRNDTLASVTSADGDYGAAAIGPSGEVIVANAPLTKWVQGTADFRGSSGGSIAVIAAQGANIFTYVTGVQIANMGSASVLVSFGGGDNPSIMGYTIAPAGGGSNIVYPNGLKGQANKAITASISGIASVLVTAQGFISKS